MSLQLLRNLKAVLDAIHKEDDRIGGRAITRVAATVSPTDSQMAVESTIGFGEYEDGAGDARLLVGGEIITASGRTTSSPFTFTGLTRGVDTTEAKTHPVGSLVYDLSQNVSAVDLLRRGLLVDFAVGEDLATIAANLGLRKCPGMTDDQLRRVIKAVAYLPKQTVDAFEKALEALTGDPNDYRVYERTTTKPYHVFAEIDVDPATDIRGRFLLNGGEQQDTSGTNTVDTDYDINHVIGVYDDTVLTRRGIRDGFTNYFSGGSFTGTTITLGSSPGAAGTPVIIDYGAFAAHYLAQNEAVRQDLGQQDRWAYLSDPLLTARCLLDQIRAAGVKVELSAKT